MMSAVCKERAFQPNPAPREKCTENDGKHPDKIIKLIFLPMQHIRREQEKSRILLVSCVPVAEMILIRETVARLQEKKDRYHLKLYISFAGWYFRSFLIYIQVPETTQSTKAYT